MNDKIKEVLFYKKIELNSAASLYNCIIERSLMSSTVNRIEEMKFHQQSIVNQAVHQDYKRESSTCLSCSMVLNCSIKCTDVH